MKDNGKFLLIAFFLLIGNASASVITVDDDGDGVGNVPHGDTPYGDNDGKPDSIMSMKLSTYSIDYSEVDDTVQLYSEIINEIRGDAIKNNRLPGFGINLGMYSLFVIFFLLKRNRIKKDS